MVREHVREAEAGYVDHATGERKKIKVKATVLLGEEAFSLNDLTITGGEGLSEERKDNLVRLCKCDLVIGAMSEEIDDIYNFLRFNGGANGLGDH